MDNDVRHNMAVFRVLAQDRIEKVGERFLVLGRAGLALEHRRCARQELICPRIFGCLLRKARRAWPATFLAACRITSGAMYQCSKVSALQISTGGNSFACLSSTYLPARSRDSPP
jgi:hypothetical protein